MIAGESDDEYRNSKCVHLSVATNVHKCSFGFDPVFILKVWVTFLIKILTELTEDTDRRLGGCE